MTLTYVRGKGLFITLPGLTVFLAATMSVGALANHLAELREFYEPA